MELQAEAERRKRASILESEGQRQAVINVAEGNKQEVRIIVGGEDHCRPKHWDFGVRGVAYGVSLQCDQLSVC